MTVHSARRPLKSRNRFWARALAQWCVGARIPPNTISSLSMVAAAFTGACFLCVPHVEKTGQVVLLLLAVVGIQLRLLCNMLDGLVAIEGGRQTQVGGLYNELPDRVADVTILVTVGYALPYSWGPELGWFVAMLAVGTAYVRSLAGALGVQQRFLGPQAKQQRMALLSVTAITAALATALGKSGAAVLCLGLAVMGVGTALTLVRRVAAAARDLSA